MSQHFENRKNEVALRRFAAVSFIEQKVREGFGVVQALRLLPGTSCLPTIVLSLQDKNHLPIEASRIILALMGRNPDQPVLSFNGAE